MPLAFEGTVMASGRGNGGKGSGPASTADTGNTGRADQYVPVFSGRQAEYREFRRRCDLYEAKMRVAGREKETVFNIVTLLTGRAWDLIEDLSIDDLKKENAYATVCARLDAAFKFEPLTELPNDFEAFFVKLQRKAGQTLQDYAQDFQYAERKLKSSHSIDLPEKVRAWWYLRRSGVTKEQRQLVMTQLGESGLTLDKTMKAMNFILGQDTRQEGSSRWSRGTTEYKANTYYAGEELDEIDEDNAYWEEDWDATAEESEAFYAWNEEEEAYLAGDDIGDFDTEEFDEVFSAYVDAKQHLNRLRTSRGFYPVVAMVQGPHQPRDQGAFTKGRGKKYSNKGGKSGKSKSSKGGGKARDPKGRGRDALGSMICLRCGQAGHRAKNCPKDSMSGEKKRKTDAEDSNVMMVENYDISDDDTDSDSDDLAVQDQGAASVLGSKQQVRRYLKRLMEYGVDINKEIDVYYCSKGFRFGNSQKETTEVCCLMPIYVGGVKRKILCYVIDGTAPILFGRPVMEKLGMAVDFSNKKVRYGSQLQWEDAMMGKRGEYVIRLTKDINTCRDSRIEEVLLPQDFRSHVDIYNKLPLCTILAGGPLEIMSTPYDPVSTAEFLEENENEATAEAAHFVPFGQEEADESEQRTGDEIMEPEDGRRLPVPEPEPVPSTSPEKEENTPTSPGEPNEKYKIENEDEKEDERLPQPSSPGLLPSPDGLHSQPSPTSSNDSVREMRKLKKNQIRQMVYEATKLKKDLDVMLAEGKEPQSKPYVIWEVYAGTGRITQRVNELKRQGFNVKAEKFGFATGWDFSKRSDQLKLLRRLRDEEPDEVFLSPDCKLWSSLQELAASKSTEAREKLIVKRQHNHDTHLTFTAVIYRHQWKSYRHAHIEHPWTSRAWKTKAWSKLDGWPTYLDQCMLGLELENDDGVLLPVRKPTCILTTKLRMHKKMSEFQCDGKHHHTPLEGGIRGQGPRSRLAENYPEKMAKVIAEVLINHTEDEDEILAAQDQQLQEEDDGPDVLEELRRGRDLLPDQGERVRALPERPDEVKEAVKANQELKKQVGIRAVDYVARLHKNLGHPGREVLVTMLKDVLATDDVILAAKHYVCEKCYERQKPGQAPPAAGRSSSVFNHRLQCDSSWIQVEEGRRCVLTICDEATRFVALRLLKSEKSTEFLKGLERAWVRHFGLPKIIRVDSAKGWSAEAIREWTSERGVALEVSPAEAHSWLAAVERKHQVTRRALEIYMEDNKQVNNKGLEEACIHVPPRINQLSWTRGFSPYQWVIGKTPQQEMSLTSELYNPGYDPDDATSFSRTQEKRLKAACAFHKADSDAKLRRAMNQKYMEQKQEVKIGQKCHYWRVQGSGHLKKNKWRGPAVCVACETAEDSGKIIVQWLVHGTSLLRCAPQHVRPTVQDASSQVAHDPASALRALEDLRARSTTQYRDLLSRQKGQRDEVFDEVFSDEQQEANEEFEAMDPEQEQGVDGDSDYAPTTIGDQDRDIEQDLLKDFREDRERGIPGVVSMMLPQSLQGQEMRSLERERTPRRQERASGVAEKEPEDSMVHEPPEVDQGAESPRKKSKGVERKKQRTTVEGTSSAASYPVPAPAPTHEEAEEDELMVDDVRFVDTGGAHLPQGWVCVENAFELDEVWLAAEMVRRGEVTERTMNVEEREQFIQAKMKELQTYFGNHVWEFANPDFLEKNKARVITARWVLTWKWDEENNRPKAKARLVLRGFEDPDLFGLEKSAPTAGRIGKLTLMDMATINGWQVVCGDVRAAFLSGAGFEREIVVKLPRDCGPLLGLGSQETAYMKMLKSAYGLADAPLLWFREASKRLERIGFVPMELDKCTFGFYENEELKGMVIIHVDDLLISGCRQSKGFQEILKKLKNAFDFGKWDVLDDKKNLTYCGGHVILKDGEIELSYEQYIKKILPITVPKGRKSETPLTEYEKTKARGLLGAIQWPGAQGVPSLLASASIQASEIAANKGESLQNLNKTLRFAKANAEVALRMTKHVEKLEDGILVVFVDAAFGVRTDNASQGGYLIVHTHKDILDGKKCKYSVISWKSYKLQRVVRSSLGAEAQAMAAAMEELYFVKLFRVMLLQPGLSVRHAQDELKKKKSVVVTDCRALYDALNRANVATTQDKRVAIECLVIASMIKETGSILRWVSSERQLADGLTKVNARQDFVEQLKGGYIQLVFDPEFKAAKKKTVEERRRSMLATTSNIAMVTAASVATSLQGCDGQEEGEEKWWISLLMALMVVGATVTAGGAIYLMQKIYYMVQGKEWKESGTQTPEEWDDHATAERCRDLADRWSYLHGEEVELRERLEGRNQEMNHEAEALQMTNESLTRMLQELHEQGRQPTEEELTLFRHDVYITRYGSVWHINSDCGHIRHHQSTMFRPCIDCVGRV